MRCALMSIGTGRNLKLIGKGKKKMKWGRRERKRISRIEGSRE